MHPHTTANVTALFLLRIYATPIPDIVEEIKHASESALLYGPFGFSKEYIDDYVARWVEIQKKYKPDMLSLDTNDPVVQGF